VRARARWSLNDYVQVLEFVLVMSSMPDMVIANSFHYLAKVFLLEASERRRREQGRPPIRKDGGSGQLERDVKELVSFYQQKATFLHVNITYTHFAMADRTEAQAKFQQMALFYHAITTSPACAPIYQAALKVPFFLPRLPPTGAVYVACVVGAVSRVVYVFLTSRTD
jgi:hypothetical protein